MARVYVHFWKREAAAIAPGTLGVSTVAHVLVIGAWVIVTLPSLKQSLNDAVQERVWYLPPPNTRPAQPASRETIRYVELAPPGEGAGLNVNGDSPGVRLEAADRDDESVGDAGRDTTTSVEQAAVEGNADTVFTIIEVDSVAARLPESAAPRYPPDLLEQRVEGQAIVQFVVDTTGRADPASFVVVVSSHPGFSASVREALPGMRFTPARIGPLKVRQLVELPFTFDIAEPVPVDTTTTQTATKRRPR